MKTLNELTETEKDEILNRFEDNVTDQLIEYTDWIAQNYTYNSIIKMFHPIDGKSEACDVYELMRRWVKYKKQYESKQ